MEFYVFDKWRHDFAVAADTEFGVEQPWNQGEASVCSACGQYTSQLPWLPPYRVELECWDTKFGDLAFGGGQGFLVSKRFKELYEGTDLTGLRGFHPVDIVRVKRHKRFKGDPPAYFYVEVVRSEAAIDEVKSAFEGYDESDGKPLSVCIVCRRPSVGHPKRWKRFVLQAGTWTGEDIFMPLGHPDFMTTERFKDFSDGNRILNAVFIPADEYWYDFYPEENLEKARELMSRLLDKTLLEKISRDGDVLRYEPATNYLVVATSNRTIRYICQLLGGMQEWNKK